MRHCMIVHSYYPHDETRVQRQAEALVKSGFCTDVVCLRYADEPKVATAGGVTIHRLPIQRDKRRGMVGQLFEYLAFLFLAAIEVTRLHLQERFDTVQVHNLPDFLVFAALVPRLTGSRILLDLHDLMPEFFCARSGVGLDSFTARMVIWQEQLACRFAHHVITVTDLWRQTLIRRGVPAEKCSVVMNVADPQYFRPTTERLGGGARGLRLIYHGTLTSRYGIDLVLHALAQRRAELPNVRLTIHGRGEYLETVRALRKSLGLEDVVQVQTEFLSSAALAELVGEHDVGVVPYRRDIFTDGILPTKLMEYMALGVPALVARTPCLSQYFDDTEVEFFAPEDVEDLGHHLAILYHDPERRRVLAQNTSNFNQKYNWAGEGEKYVQLVKQFAAAIDPSTEKNLVHELVES